MNLNDKSEEELRQIAEAVRLLKEKKKYNYIEFLFPDTGPLRRELYPKHIEFFNSGSIVGERAFIAANRVGKTLSGLYEMVLHCTGRYPHWWKGKRFNHPVECWLVGETWDTVRDTMQQDLVGRGGEMWTGLIPRDCIAREPLAMPNTGGGYSQYFIKHVSSGTSRIVVKTYQAGIESFKGAAIHVVMLDEQCPLNIYTECQMRTVTTRGIVYLTFTPDKGLTDTVLYFIEDPYKFKVKIGWKDVPHITPEMREEMLKKIPPHLIPCKTEGEPYLGSGAIYPIPVSEIMCESDIDVRHMPKAYGFDPGWNKTAAIWGAYDKKSDTIYLYSEYYQGKAECAVHAKGIKARGAWIPGIADPATEYGSKGKDGVSYLPLYEEEGLNLTMANNKNKEERLFQVYERLRTGRLKVCANLKNWFYEYGMYRRDDNGRIVKKNDHLMDATTYLVVHMLDIMETEPDEDDYNVSINSNTSDRNDITGY